MKRLSPPLRLRTALPLLIGGVTFLGILLLMGFLNAQKTRRVWSLAEDRLQAQAFSLRNILSDLSVEGHPDLAERRFMDVLLDPRIERMALVDSKDRVRFSSRREWIGHPAGDLEGYDPALAERLKQENRSRLTRSGSSRLIAYYPVDLGLQQASLRRQEQGILFIGCDLSPDLANARLQTIQEGQWILGIWLVTALLMFLLLQAFVTRKVDRITRTMARIEAGSLEARTRLPGGSELDHLGRAFDRLLDQLAMNQKDLKASHTFLDTIVEAIPDVIFVVDAETRRILRFNRAGERLLGLDRQDVLGLSSHELFPPEQAGFLNRTDETVLEERRVVDIPEERIQTRLQGERILHTTKVPILNPEGKPVYLLGISEDITERKLAEAALQESEAAFRRMIMAAPIPIGVVDPSGRIQFVNHHFTQLFGYSSEELPTLDDWWTRAYPDPWERSGAMARWSEAMASARASQGTIHLPQDETILCKDGSQRIVELQGAFLGDTTLVLFKDLTNRVRQELLIRDALEFSEKLMATMAIGAVAYHGRTGRCALVNDATLQIIGGTREYHLAQDFRQIPQWKSSGLTEAADIALATGRDQHLEIHVHTRSGHERWLDCRLSTFRSGNEPHLLVLIIDETKRHRAEEERRNLEHKMAQVGRLESLGSLAGGVAHDMNNVLAAILSVASLHEEQAPPGSRLHKSMETISKACIRGSSMVKGLLGFARESLAEQCALDLNTLVREEVALLERTTLQKIRLETDLEEPLLPVHGDPSALSHALMNLCVNAVDAMPEGGTLTLRTRNQGAAGVLLEVVDTGEGMPPEVLEKAMDPFFTTKPQGKGTGLGLSIVYGTVKAHRGQLEIQSDPGQGTTIAIQLPASLVGTGSSASSTPGHQGAQGLRILLVDDDDLVQQSTSELLEMMGHEVTLASSGEGALALLRDGLEADCVMLDMNMPGMGGARALPAIRALRPHLPVLLSTGRADQEAVDLVRSTPRAALLAKPFSMRELDAHLQDLP